MRHLVSLEEMKLFVPVGRLDVNGGLASVMWYCTISLVEEEAYNNYHTCNSRVFSKWVVQIIDESIGVGFRTRAR